MQGPPCPPTDAGRTPLLAVTLAGALALLSGACRDDLSADEGVPSPAGERPTGSRTGKWYRARRSKGDLTHEQRTRIGQLEAIGYASGVEEAGSESGVTVHDIGLAQPGLTFFVSGHAPVAILVDMDGRKVHEWTCSADDAWPEREDPRGQRHFWRRARLEENGDVLALFENIGLVRLDRDSNILWAHEGRAHHDLDVGSDGRIYLLERKAGLVPWIDPQRPVLDDVFTLLDATGKVVERFSLLECIRNSPLRKELEQQILANFAQGRRREAEVREERKEELEQHPERAKLLDLAGDLFHTNTIQYLDGSQTDRSPHFAEGNLLVCIRNLSRVAIIDPRERSVVWSLSGRWRGQHESVLLGTGALLLFDNNGAKERGQDGFSEVLEIDPLTGEIRWSYIAARKNEFNSPIAGSCQRLPNGNTLITESTNGRVFEVTREGQTVWEFLSPYRAGEGNELVAFLPDAQRVAPGFLTDWLQR